MENTSQNSIENINQINSRSGCRLQTQHSRDTKKQSKKLIHRQQLPVIVQCTRCGYRGHTASECRCSRSAVCNKCGKIGNFDRFCRATSIIDNNLGVNNQSTRRSQPQHRKNLQNSFSRSQPNAHDRGSSKQHNVHHLCNYSNSGIQEHEVHYLSNGSENDARASDDDYIFSLSPASHAIKVELYLASEAVTFIVDTGASINIINRETWENCNKYNITCRQTAKHVFAYGHNSPLSLIGEYDMPVKYKNIKRLYTFVIFDGDYPCILGLQPSEELGIVTVNVTHDQVYAVDQTLDDIMNRHASVFQGLG